MQNIISRFRAGLAHGMCWGLFFAGTSLHATPDLVVNHHRLGYNVAVQTKTFSANDCAVVEGCTVAGTRRLLLFDVGLVNAGDGDLVIGNPAERPDLFQFSACHGHYHMDGAAAYELLTTNGQSVITVRKQGFCFRDVTPAFTNAPEARYPSCDNQGLTVGWEDVYDRSLDCQWLDITDVPAGKYLLRVVVNPDAKLQESNYENNVADFLITLGTPGQTDKPPKCVNHDDWTKWCKWWDWKKLKDKFKGHWKAKCKIPRCACKCHKPPGKPGNGNGHDEDDDDHGNGNGNGGDDDDDGGNGNGKDDDDDDDDHGGNGKHGDDDDDHGNGNGNGNGKHGDDDDDHGNGNGNGKDGDDDDDHGNGYGNGGDDDDGGGKNNGKCKGYGKCKDLKCKVHGKANGNGKDKGTGKDKGKDKSNGKNGGKPAAKAKAKK